MSDALEQKKKAIFERALQVFGLEEQIRSAGEEAAELTVATHHYLRPDRNRSKADRLKTRNEIIEELAAARLTQDCIISLLHLENEVEKRYDEKLDVFTKKIDEEERCQQTQSNLS
jgi:hypothetical protein